MTTLHNILQANSAKQYATNTGTRTHNTLRHIIIDDTHPQGDTELIKRINSTPGLASFFCKNAKTEVPIAGTINKRFISRRIDRMIIDHTNKTIKILDYKTDTTKTAFYTQYVAQIKEYTQLLHAIHPTYRINGYILWTHDFSLEKIV